MNDGLTASEREQCVVLLQRFAEHDLDQHDAWRLDTRDGPLFVRVNRNRGRRAAVTGARRGELAALRWTDIRWGRGRPAHRAQLRHPPGAADHQGHQDPPKESSVAGADAVTA